MKSVYPIVRKFFQDASGEHVPGEITRWVAKERGISPGDQSAGAVRAAIVKLHDEGFIERLPGMPLRYKRSEVGSAPLDPSTPVAELRLPVVPGLSEKEVDGFIEAIEADRNPTPAQRKRAQELADKAAALVMQAFWLGWNRS